MEKCYIFLYVILVASIQLIPKSDAVRSKGVCSWLSNHYSTCFLCHNRERCIERRWYCNGNDDCGDNSDEKYCTFSGRSSECPSGMIACSNHWNYHVPPKCIPSKWVCDGIKDCNDSKDERDCHQGFDDDDLLRNVQTDYIIAKVNALQWLNSQKKTKSATEMWGSSADRVAIALYLATDNFAKNKTREGKDLAYEVSIQLLSRLSKKKLQDIPSTDLASYLNAFLVTCVDPRKFHGLDIVEELRTRVNRQNYTNPYVLLSLCKAGVTMTESDKMKLIDAFWAKRRTFWTDIQAGVLMALACASRQPGNNVDSETLQELAAELKQHQYRNGTVENLQTTALVLQALFATEPDSDPDNFDDTKALQQVIAMQKEDGSFGSFMNTYYVLPVLNCMSLVNISSDHCESSQKDEMSGLNDLINRSGPKLRIQYSIWIGDDKDLERNMALRVPANMFFYGVMEMAADIDSRYRYEYVVKNRKPYVNALSGLQDDPEKGKFWFLYTVVEGKLTPSEQSPADVKPKENDHFVMWYKRGSWVE